MGVIIDSCKRTVACSESDDENGYKRVYLKKLNQIQIRVIMITMIKKIQKMKKKIKMLKNSTKC